MKEQWNESTAVAKGLYDPRFEHDNCGIGAVVNIKGIKTHQTVENALKIVENLKHRAGKDADGKTGDGDGILLQISHKFFKKALRPLGIELGEERDYGVGMFFFPQEEVYAGQVVGEHSHDNDLVVNVTKSKKLTNMRASGSDDKARIIPPVIFSLEEALEYIKEEEYVEVTPKSMRMRKIILDETERKRANKNA